ncbi:hypothetical protein D3C78_1519880 [compost metagenome]
MLDLIAGNVVDEVLADLLLEDPTEIARTDVYRARYFHETDLLQQMLVYECLCSANDQIIALFVNRKS